jgi:hypothetical protein
LEEEEEEEGETEIDAEGEDCGVNELVKTHEKTESHGEEFWGRRRRETTDTRGE